MKKHCQAGEGTMIFGGHHQRNGCFWKTFVVVFWFVCLFVLFWFLLLCCWLPTQLDSMGNATLLTSSCLVMPVSTVL